MFCSSRPICLERKGGKMALLIVKVADAYAILTIQLLCPILSDVDLFGCSCS